MVVIVCAQFASSSWRLAIVSLTWAVDTCIMPNAWESGYWRRCVCFFPLSRQYFPVLLKAHYKNKFTSLFCLEHMPAVPGFEYRYRNQMLWDEWWWKWSWVLLWRQDNPVVASGLWFLVGHCHGKKPTGSTKNHWPITINVYYSISKNIWSISGKFHRSQRVDTKR